MRWMVRTTDSAKAAPEKLPNPRPNTSARPAFEPLGKPSALRNVSARAKAEVFARFNARLNRLRSLRTPDEPRSMLTAL